MQSVIYEHKMTNTKLYVYASTSYSMRYATIFSSVSHGEGSLLSLKCAAEACSLLNVYDDWTTEIHIQPWLVLVDTRLLEQK